MAFNAAIIVKLKKMYNNIKKSYILNMYHAFLMIDRESNTKLRELDNDEYYEDDHDHEQE